MSYNFTVIIPHKNIPVLLQRAIESVPQRDDLQLIIVDDNSDPVKVDFNNFPVTKRLNTEIIFTKNGKGAGYARNIGLNHAKGTWILFMDADDEFTEEIDNILDRCIADKTNDLIYFRCKVIDAESGDEILDHPFTKAYHEDTNKLKYLMTVPWGKIIKKELIDQEHLTFEEIICANDAMFSIKASYLCHNFKYLPETGYKYYVSDKSLSQQVSNKYAICRLKWAIRHLKYCKQHNIECGCELAKINYANSINKIKSTSIFAYYYYVVRYNRLMGLSTPILDRFYKCLKFQS